jgi:hypothetical protein
MQEAISVYVDFIEAFYKKDGGELLIEHRFDLSKVHPGLFGTADAVHYSEKTRVLTVTDYKHGAGIAVEVVDNPQLQYYALGALLSLKYKAEWVDIVVVQPRCLHKDGPKRAWRIAAIDLLEFQGRLVDAAIATEQPDAPLVPGDQCRFCPGAPKCPALRSQALTAAQKEFLPTVEYVPEDLAETLDKLDVIEGWCSSVRAFAYAEAHRGREIPGYKMVAKRATRKWIEGVDCTMLSKEFKLIEERFLEEPSLKSPAQVEKVLKQEGHGAKALGELVVSASSGFKLVRESDPGVPVKLGPMSEFSEIVEDPFS